MSEPARNRFALDLEDLERQLRGAGQAPRPGQQADPLAELTRIVGQDDPLKDIFAERRQPPRPAMRQEPSFEVVPPQPAPAVPETSQPPAEMRGALNTFATRTLASLAAKMNSTTTAQADSGTEESETPSC